jgi:acylpyruvate hydrolase
LTYIVLQEEKINVPKILCLGLNYAEHAKEMKSDKPETPVIFMKPSSAIIHDKEKIVIPDISNEVHHEVEVVLLIGKDGKNIPKDKALEYIDGIGIGLDLTLRDIQKEAKAKGRPWTVSKGFDTSAPVSEFVSIEKITDLNNLSFNLKINNEIKQSGNTSDMLFKPDEIISYLSTIFTLQKGDLIYTGTPEGVGQIVSGDKLLASLENIITLEVIVN